MTIILISNINRLTTHLIEKYVFLQTVKYLKIQVKVLVSMFMYENEEANTNILFYKNDKVKILFYKYIRMLENEFNYFKNSIHINEEYMYANSDNCILKESEMNRSTKNFQSLLSDYVKNRTKHHREIMPSELYSPEIEPKKHALIQSDSKFIKWFMFPYEKYSNPISHFVFETMKSTVEFDNDKINLIRKTMVDEFALKMLNNRMNKQTELYSKTISSTFYSFNTTENLNERIDKLNEYAKDSAELSVLIHTVKNNSVIIKKMVNEERMNNYKKIHCKLTLLLDIDKMLKKLNSDIITTIKSFVGEDFIEKIRKYLVKQKYFSQPNLNIREYLKSMKKPELIEYCKHNLYLTYDMTIFESEWNEYENLDEDDTRLSMYDTVLCRSIYATNIVSFRKKKMIALILSFNRLIENYEFQKELYFISKMFIQKRNRIEPR